MIGMAVNGEEKINNEVVKKISPTENLFELGLKCSDFHSVRS